MQDPLSEQEFSAIAPGDTIFFHLSPKELPTHPEKEWSGIVTAIHSVHKFAIVQVLTEGFEGDEDEVHCSQIIQVKRQHVPNAGN